MTKRIILEAKILITHSSLSISEELNFKDSSYFIRLFKKATKFTPEQFRNKQLKYSFIIDNSNSFATHQKSFSWAFI